MTARTWEDGDTVSYIYGTDGSLGRMTDSGTGRTTKHCYDFQGRVMRVEETDGDGYANSVSWSYDDRNNLSARPHTLGGSTRTDNYSYDDDNRLTEQTQGEVSAVYTYDAMSRITALTGKLNSSAVVSTDIGYVDPTGTTTSGQVATWTNTAGGNSTAYSYTYDQRGNITSISDGTNTISYVYDSKDQLIRENNQAADKTWVYTYDNGGNILTRTEYVYTTGDLGAALGTKSYVYGDSTWKDLLTSYHGTTLSYDAIGNLTGDGTWTYAWEHGRQLASQEKSDTTIVYGGSGLLGGGQLSEPNGGAQPESFPSDYVETYTSSTLTYDYAAEGKRIRKSVTDVENITTHTFTWGGITPPFPYEPTAVGGLTEQTTFSGTTVNTVYNYVYANGVLTDLTVQKAIYHKIRVNGPNILQSQTEDTLHFTYDVIGPATVTYNNAVYYYLRNAQGDVAGIVDNSGTLVVSYSYDAWGNPLTATGSMATTLGKLNPFRYRGYVYDEETGLYYLTSRYYNPSWGRFINADGYASTGQGLLGSNMFAYCENNPTNHTDPSGTMVYGVIGGTVSGGFGTAGSVGTMIIWDDKGNCGQILTGFVGGGTPTIGVSLDLFLISNAEDIFRFTYGLTTCTGFSAGLYSTDFIVGEDTEGRHFFGNITSIGLSAIPFECHAGIGYARLTRLFYYKDKPIPEDVSMDFFSDLPVSIQAKLKRHLLIPARRIITPAGTASQRNRHTTILAYTQ